MTSTPSTIPTFPPEGFTLLLPVVSCLCLKNSFIFLPSTVFSYSMRKIQQVQLLPCHCPLKPKYGTRLLNFCHLFQYTVMHIANVFPPDCCALCNSTSSPLIMHLSYSPCYAKSSLKSSCLPGEVPLTCLPHTCVFSLEGYTSAVSI